MITNKYPDPKQGHILINLSNGLGCKTGERLHQHTLALPESGISLAQWEDPC